MTIAGLILASGRASRFGSDKRATLIDATTPMLHAVFRAFEALDGPVFSVIPLGDDFGLAACTAFGVIPVINANADTGMGDSLALGMKAIMAQGSVTGIIIGLADMPWVKPQTIALIAQTLAMKQQLVVPIYDEKPGHPRGLPAAAFSDLCSATGDEGARHLVDWSAAVRLTVDDEGILQDVDTPQDLAACRSQ
ncbi:MAG: nucleotidyltransferase family protein [Burkholderiales bacterium]|nr:nucleotidyltransferase family protein [Burkholderiales bacterium]